jgi:hypothetical protein
LFSSTPKIFLKAMSTRGVILSIDLIPGKLSVG